MKSLVRVSIALAIGLGSTGASAITITATQGASTLVTAFVGGAGAGIVITGQTFSGHQQDSFLSAETETSSGTYTNVSGTYGIGPGIVLTTGAVEERSFTDPETQITEIFSGYGDGPNRVTGNTTEFLDENFNPALATTEQDALLQPLSPFLHYDVTELIINFDVQSGYDRVQFNVAYGTDEYPEFIASQFIDIFAVFLNGTNIALVNDLKVNVDHPAFTSVTGTELDGMLAPGASPLLTLSALVNPGANTLRFMIADTGDSALDSTVYLSGLTAVPLPASVWLLGTAAGGLLGRGWLKSRRRRAVGAT